MIYSPRLSHVVFAAALVVSALIIAFTSSVPSAQAAGYCPSSFSSNLAVSNGQGSWDSALPIDSASCLNYCANYSTSSHFAVTCALATYPGGYYCYPVCMGDACWEQCEDFPPVYSCVVGTGLYSASGSSAAQCTYTSEPPTANISADVTTIYPGGQAWLAWGGQGSTSLSCSTNFGGSTSHYNYQNLTIIAAGNQYVSPTQTTTYTVTCSSNEGTTVRSVTVTVVQPPPPSIAAPATTYTGNIFGVTWGSTMASACTVYYNGSQVKTGVSGSYNATAPSTPGTATVTVSCQTSVGTLSTTKNISVLANPVIMGPAIGGTAAVGGGSEGDCAELAISLGTSGVCTTVYYSGMGDCFGWAPEHGGNIGWAGCTNATWNPGGYLEPVSGSYTYFTPNPATIEPYPTYDVSYNNVGTSGGFTSGTYGSWSSGAYTRTVTYVPPAYPDMVGGVVSPTSVTSGVATTFYGNITNQGTAATPSQTFNNTFLITTDTAFGGAIHNSSSYTGSLAPGASNQRSFTYTFSSPGPWYLRLCADSSASITESDENNNCGTPQLITVGAPVSGSCSASPLSATAGSTNVTWTAAPSGGNGSYTYSWTGTDSLTGTGISTSKTYATTGNKYAAVAITSNGQTANVLCDGDSNPSDGIVVVNPSAPQCNDGINNSDGDSWTDYPADPGCSSTTDTTESPNPQCSDGINNSDGDAWTDYPNDPGCNSTDTIRDDSESPNPPTVDITATPPTIDSGGSTTISWTSSGATSCTGNGFSTGGAITGGPITVGPITDAQSYSVTCTGPGGPVTDVVTVNVTYPTADITATPGRVSAGIESFNLTFSADQVTSCTVTGTDGYTSGALAGPTVGPTTVSRTITTQTTYTIDCGSAEDVVIVNVKGSFDEF